MDAILKETTRYTLNSIERKTLGGFDRTIPRSGLNRKLNGFLDSGYSIFPLIAPGGYGKSVALAHWVKDLPDGVDCFFCTADFLLSSLGERNKVRKRVRLGLDDPRNMYNTFLTGKGNAGASLVVVIDALDEIGNDPERLMGIVDYLFDAANIYRKAGTVKFVFSIRETTWRMYHGERFGSTEASQWFEQVSPMLDTGYTNLDQLSNAEIRSIIANYSRSTAKPLVYECIPWEIRELLRIPIQLHFISRLLQDAPSMELPSKTDVTRSYLDEFVFQSKHSEEKEHIVWKILAMMDDHGDHMPVAKRDLRSAYPIHLKGEANYFHAYQELLSDGILVEEREENASPVFVTRVGFRHQNFFVYLYALYLIRENGELTFTLIDSIARLKAGDVLVNDIVATLYQVAYEAENLAALKDFCTLPERILSSLPVRLTVGALFRETNSIREKLVAIFAASEAGRTCFFEQYVDTNFLFNNYVMRVREYSKHKSGKEAVLFTNAIFYLAAFLKMDREACMQHAAILGATEPDKSVHPWPIGRKVFSHLLQTVFVEGQTGIDFSTYVETHTKTAYSYPGYLERGLIEFEMYVMLAMVLTRDFAGLERLLDTLALRYGVMHATHCKTQALQRNQNGLPLFFLEYARYKLDYNSVGRPEVLWDIAIGKYPTNFDDYQYLIVLNWFLVDYLCHHDNVPDAMKYYDAALEIAKTAGYDFYEAFLLVNDPLEDAERIRKGEAMIAASGFARAMFTFPIGPCASQ